MKRLMFLSEISQRHGPVRPTASECGGLKSLLEEKGDNTQS